MTDFEKKIKTIKTKLIEDEYAEKFRQLDTEESIAHINMITSSYAKSMRNGYSLKQRWKLKRIF